MEESDIDHKATGGINDHPRGEMKQGSWLSVGSPAALIPLLVELAHRQREMVIYIKAS